MVQPYKPLYSAEEAAEVLGVPKNLIYDLMSNGQIPYLILRGAKLSGSKKIRGSDLENFIETYRTEEVRIIKDEEKSSLQGGTEFL